MTRRLRIAPVVPFLALAGCYTYVPATMESVPEGAEVRALISTEAQNRLFEALGQDLREIQGTLVSRGTDVLLFEVRVPEERDAFTGRALYQRVDLAPRDVLRVDRKQTDGFKTGALVAAAAAVVVGGVVLAFGDQEPGRPPSNGTPPAERRVRFNLLRLPIGIP